jgi:hypothetical protein
VIIVLHRGVFRIILRGSEEQILFVLYASLILKNGGDFGYFLYGWEGVGGYAMVYDTCN